MSFKFQVFPPLGRPNIFTQEDECVIASETFEDLAKTHFQRKITPYLVALIEDSTQNSALYDFNELRKWFGSKDGSVEHFTSPNTNELCKKIYVLGINKLGKVLPYAFCETQQSFKDFNFVADASLKDSFFVKNISYLDKFPLSDDDCLSSLGLIFNEPGISDSITELDDVTKASELTTALGLFIKKGNADRIQSIKEKLEKLYGNNSFVQEALAFTQFELDVNKGIYHFEKALELNPKRAGYILQNLAYLYMKAGNYEKAIDCMNKRHKIIPEPFNANLYIQIGKIYFEQNSFDEALKLFRIALDIDPNNKQSKQLMADTNNKKKLADLQKSSQNDDVEKDEEDEKFSSENKKFPSFENEHRDRIYKDPKRTSRLNFNQVRKVFIHDNLMMGMYWKHPVTTLLAFDKTSGRLRWSIPLKEKYFHYSLTSIGLALAYENDPTLYIYNPKNGKKLYEIALPSCPQDRFNKIHITSSGFCYYMAEKKGQRMLYGGQISHGKWETAFVLKTPSGKFSPVGNHICFKQDFKNFQIIISQDGSVQELSDCNGLLYKNGKLFTIKSLEKEKKYTIAMQAMEESGVFKLKGSRSEFQVDTEFEIKHVCDDDTVVIFKGEKPCFIDIANKKLIEVKHKVASFGQTFVDAKKTAVWTWDELSKDLWKHTKNGSENIGKLNSGRGTSFLHVDEEDRLYFVDIPF